MKHLLLYFEADFLELKQHFSFEHQFQGISFLSYNLLPSESSAIASHVEILNDSVFGILLSMIYELKFEKPEGIFFLPVKSYKLHIDVINGILVDVWEWKTAINI